MGCIDGIAAGLLASVTKVDALGVTLFQVKVTFEAVGVFEFNRKGKDALHVERSVPKNIRQDFNELLGRKNFDLTISISIFD